MTQAPDSPRVSARIMLWRAVRLRCPVCGTGGLFFQPHHRLRLGLPERCGGCELRFDREAGHWAGSFGLNTIVSFTALFAVLIVGLFVTWPDPPAVILIVASLTVAIAVPLVFAPWSATLWLVIDLRMRPLEPGEAVILSVPSPPPDGHDN